MKVEIERLVEKPFLVGLARVDAELFDGIDKTLVRELIHAWEIPFCRTGATSFRAVALERLPLVLKTGIDVEPSDAVFYVGEFEKCVEYGGWPKLVLALDCGFLTSTFRETRADISDDELASIKKVYPTVLTSEDGSSLWFSRLNASDPRLSSPYEVGYARWIETNPLQALKGILVLCDTSDDASCEQIRYLFGGRK